jgi:hypothetical protein
LAGACNSNSLARGLLYLTFCLQKQGRDINTMRRVVSENASKELSVIIRLGCEEVSLQIEFTTLPPKKHNLFVRNWNKKGIGEKGIAATG